MTARAVAFGAAAAAFAVVIGWGVAGLPDFGGYPGPLGDVINKAAPSERHTISAPVAVVMDYRGFDTLGEEFIIFTAAAAIVLLLRDVLERPGKAPLDPIGDEELQAIGVLSIAPVALLGIHLTLHGHVSPGGGFQGGVVLASALMLVYLAGDWHAHERVARAPLVEAVEGSGAAGFVTVGLVGLVAAGAFLENFLPLGSPGGLNSGGTIPLLNVVAGIAVATAIVLIAHEFLHELLVKRRDAER